MIVNNMKEDMGEEEGCGDRMSHDGRARECDREQHEGGYG